jgi:1-pyrroline-5-carboxylate dehydrogenase
MIDVGCKRFFCNFTKGGRSLMVQPYKHEPLTDFTVEANKKAFEDALKKVEAELGKDYDLIIGGERISTEEKIVSINPANKTEVIGRVSKANKKQ